MKEFVVYFARNESYLNSKEFEFEYSVEANDDEGATQKAIQQFHSENPRLALKDYTYGFSKN